MNHIAPLWNQFSKRILPDSASDMERLQMRRSFYAGASLLFSIVTEKTNDPNISSTDGARFMGELANEITSFADQISNGKA